MMKAGEAIEFKSQPAITHEMLREYAAASGDFNPIHLDEAVAKKMGLPGIIAHGMLTAGFLAARASELAPGWRVRRFQCRFKAMTFPGDVISVGGLVKDAAENSVTLELQARNQKGEVTTTAVVQLAG
jgi:acyl dehydratase